MTVAPREITVTPTSGQSRYGDSDPTLSYSITSGSLLSGDNFTGTLARASGENVGNRAITQGTLSLPSNYTLTVAPGVNFAITAGRRRGRRIRTARRTGDADPDPLTTGSGGLLGPGLAARQRRDDRDVRARGGRDGARRPVPHHGERCGGGCALELHDHERGSGSSRSRHASGDVDDESNSKIYGDADPVR